MLHIRKLLCEECYSVTIHASANLTILDGNKKSFLTEYTHLQVNRKWKQKTVFDRINLAASEPQVRLDGNN